LKKEQQEQAEERARQAEAKEQENLKREAEERVKHQAELQELQRQREAQRAALRRKEEESHLMIAEKWAHLVRKTEGVSRFQFQIMSLQENIPDEIKDWRSRITWKYREGKAFRIVPPLPIPERDGDLQEVRLAIWKKEVQKYREKDEQEQQKQDNIARLKWLARPENLTYTALWDEWFALQGRPQNERFKLILNEWKRREKQQKRTQLLSEIELDTEIEEKQAWTLKYGKYDCFQEVHNHMGARIRELCEEKYLRQRRTEERMKEQARVRAEREAKMKAKAQETERLKRPIQISYTSQGESWHWKTTLGQITKGELTEEVVEDWIFRRPAIQWYFKGLGVTSLPGRPDRYEHDPDSGVFAYQN
jgi:hypothetical protein